MRATHGKKCYCGCGQAPGTTCRQRLLSCTGCGVKTRQTREALATVRMSCSCGGDFVPHCMEDRARWGDAEADAQLAAMPVAELPTIKGAPRNVGARFWCMQCSAFVAGESAMCAKCRHTGPHHFGEDAPTTGNADRRARLKRVQRKRRDYRPAPVMVGNDIPF